MLRRLLTASFLTFVPLCAQDKTDLRRFVPEDAQIVMRLQAPALWKEAFGPTRLGGLLRTPLMAPWVRMMSEGYDAALESSYFVAMGPELVRNFVQDYRGEIVVAMHLELPEEAANAMDEDELDLDELPEPKWTAMLTMAPAAGLDLAEFRAGFRRADEQAIVDLGEAPKITDLTVGEHTFRVFHADDMQITQLEMVDGHLVLFFGNDVLGAASKLLADSPRATELPPPAPLSVRCDFRMVDELEEGFEALLELASEDGEPGRRTGMRLAFDTFRCLGAFDVQLQAFGQAVVLDTSFATRGDKLGLLAPLLAAGSPAKLLRCVPPDQRSFSLRSFDLMAMSKWIDTAVEEEGEEFAAQLETIAAQFLEANKVRLREDLLDHIGREVLVLGGLHQLCADVATALEDGEEPDPREMFGGTCLAIALRDGRAFGASLEAVVRANGVHAGRRTEDYHGVPIHQVVLGGLVSLEYAVTDEALWLVLGKGIGRDQLRAALDARGESRSEAEVAAAFAALPEGWNGVRRVPIADWLRLLADIAVATQGRGANDAEAKLGIDILRGLAKEMTNLAATELLVGDYTSPAGWRTVYRW
jgi:hypothetical protein